MTPRQEAIIYSAKHKISELRSWLCDVLYRTDKLTDEEFKRIKEVHDLIVKADENL